MDPITLSLVIIFGFTIVSNFVAMMSVTLAK
ncbi:hypothetical protein H705_00199 [Bartonella bacilliformis Cond044]|nr:hypothetical protein H705_00199 [Bartonella bacilliformis Cond044]